MIHQRSRKYLPLVILGFGIMVSVFGLLAIFDASVIDSFKTFGDKFHYVKQQSVWILVGVIVASVVSSIPTGQIKRYSPIIFGFTLFLMVAVLIPGIGSKFLGARRWIILGPIVVQPSELLKISLVIYLASWLEVERPLSKFLTLLGLSTLLVMLQPDLGTALIITGVSFMVYYLSGVNLKEIAVFILAIVVSALSLIFISPYRLERLKTFMDPTIDPLGASYHINQVMYGLGSGGLYGVGLGKSRQKYAYLPEATTDSIFVIIAEEVGFIGASIVMIVIVSIIRLGFMVPQMVTDRFGKLLSAGVLLIFLIQTFVNLSSMVALVPLTGVPLPFISYGGSSLVTNFISLGLLMNVSKKI